MQGIKSLDLNLVLLPGVRRQQRWPDCAGLCVNPQRIVVVGGIRASGFQIGITFNVSFPRGPIDAACAELVFVPACSSADNEPWTGRCSTTRNTQGRRGILHGGRQK
ncbi:hypothetical protein BJY01DRAFT_222264 [Aspergillus pseudoustus]|uniref:Uncharacterized protein n=1 Tax=Aspergillus pseudoustus TaxID=1810923 RepID=A0ABR4J885_9EURO